MKGESVMRYMYYEDDTQKRQGTTFFICMAEMLKMQIFVPAGKEGTGC